MIRPWRLALMVVVAAALLPLAACKLGPNFTRPEAPTDAGYSRSVPSGGVSQGIVYGGEVADDWYQLFHSEALGRLVRQALANNPDLDAARHGLAAAQYELQAVSGTALPQISMGANVSRTHINGSYLYAPDSSMTITANRYTLGPTLAYNLDVFGGVRRSIESQAAATASARDQALNTYVTLVDQVVVTAFDDASTSARIETMHKLVDELQDQLDLTRKLERGGKVTRVDTLQAQTQLENIRAELPGLEQQRDTDHNALAKLCGTSPDQIALPSLTLKDFTLPMELPLSLPSALVRRRPDILAAEDNLHQASAEIGVAQAARLPAFSISGQYAQQAIKLNELFTQPGGIWSAALDVTMPLFDGGTLAARADEAKERYRQAQASYRSTVVGAFVDVANALQALQHDADGYAARNRALEVAGEARELALAQFRAGKLNALQVLSVEQQYQNAALTQVQAQGQRFADTAMLFGAIGGGWWNAPHDPAALAVVDATNTPSAPAIAANVP